MTYWVSRSAKSCRRKHRQRQIAAMGACLSGRQVFQQQQMQLKFTTNNKKRLSQYMKQPLFIVAIIIRISCKRQHLFQQAQCCFPGWFLRGKTA